MLNSAQDILFRYQIYLGLTAEGNRVPLGDHTPKSTSCLCSVVTDSMGPHFNLLMECGKEV